MGDRAARAGEVKTGRQVCPLAIPKAEVKTLYAAAQRRRLYQTVTTKALASGIPAMIPATLADRVVGPAFEARLMDHLPVMPMTTPSCKYIKHTGTTGTPAIVDELVAKAELSPTFTSVTVTVLKIAAWTSAGRESLSDFDSFQSYLTNDLLKRIVSLPRITSCWCRPARPDTWTGLSARLV